MIIQDIKSTTEKNGPASRAILMAMRIRRYGAERIAQSPSQKPPLMRSSRRTTPQVAENSIVDDATDACSLRHICATFLANSSASLGRPYFYLIQSNDWKSLCLLTGLSVQD